MAQQAQVQVVGMKALRRDLNKMTDDVKSPLYAAIVAAGKSAVEPVAARVRASVPHQSGRLAGTVRTSGTRTGGNVRMGSKAVPYAGWLDFGGDRPDGSSREYLASGRYLFPAAAGLASSAATAYSNSLERILADSRLWTNTSANPESVHD